MGYADFNPVAAAAPRLAARSQMASQLAQGVTQLGAAISGGITGAQEERTERERLAMADRDRRELIALTRYANEIAPDQVGSVVKGARVTDPSELFPPPKSAKNLDLYLKSLSDAKEKLALGLLSQPNVDMGTIDKLLGMPGWSAETRKALQEQKAGMLTSQLTSPQAPVRAAPADTPASNPMGGGNLPSQIGAVDQSNLGKTMVETKQGTPAQQMGITNPPLTPTSSGTGPAVKTPAQLESQLTAFGTPGDVASRRADTMQREQELGVKQQKEAGIASRAAEAQRVARDRVELAKKALADGTYLKKLAITSANARSVSETAGTDAENIEFALGAYIDPTDPNAGIIPELEAEIQKAKTANVPNKDVVVGKLENELKLLESERKRMLDTWKKALERKRLADEELLKNSGATQPKQPAAPAQGKPLNAQIMMQAKQMFGADKEAAKKWLIQQGYSVQ